MSEDTNIVDQMEKSMANYQKVMEETIAKHEAMVKKAHADLEALVQAGTPKPPKPHKPECQWTDVNGTKLLVLNEAAAEFFTAIFQQMGTVATELGKLAQQGK